MAQANSQAWFQQGDVMIKPVAEIPEEAEVTGDRVLAKGEATGHQHVAEAEDVRLFVYEGQLFMSAPNGTIIVHQEHRPLEIPSGNYVIGTVREYDHFAEEARRVID